VSSDPMAGGAAMHRSKNVVQNAVNPTAKERTTLLAALKAGRPAAVHRVRAEALDVLPSGMVSRSLKTGNRAEADDDPHLPCCLRQI
jgi:hypothetical protein